MNWLQQLRLAIEIKLLDYLQRRCKHEPRYVKADALDGQFFDKTEVQWCYRCGAHRVVHRVEGYAGSPAGRYTVSDWTVPQAAATTLERFRARR